MRISILLFTISLVESDLFLIVFMFNWTYINLFTFLSISFGLSVWEDLVDPLFRVFQLWILLFYPNLDIFKLVFRCAYQFSFTRSPEKFSTKFLVPLLSTKCNLLSLKCLIGSILSPCERNEIFFSLHIRTSLGFIWQQSKPWNNARHHFSNDVARSIVAFAISLTVFSVLKSFVFACRTVYFVKLASHGP